MNSNKYDFYKSSIYYLIANALILIAGIVVMIVCGFNLDTSIKSGHLIFTSAFSIVISVIVNFIYVGFRYDFAKAFSVAITTTHNVLLSTALICILRIPVSESIIMGFILLVGLTTLFTLVLTEKLKGIDLKKANYNEVIKTTLNSSVKQIVVLSAIAVAIMLLCLIITSPSMFMLAREFFVMISVLIYSSLTIILPSWCYFSSKIKRIKRTKVDGNITNQKVVKAVQVETTKVEDNTIEPDVKIENESK